MTATATVPTAKPLNPYRISAKAALKNADILSLDWELWRICAASSSSPNRSRMSAALAFFGELDSSVVPACCSEGCEVEPGGHCEHGCPSVLLAYGII